MEPQTINEGRSLLWDLHDAVYMDKWMWIVLWGPPRLGKSTLAMQLSYEIYKDWNKVLDSFVFTLPQTIYKLRQGRPERHPAQNGRMRVPLLIWDDFAAHSNKATTRNDDTWNLFKGGFDTLGTEIAVLIATMLSPESPTEQLRIKFTNEIMVPARGCFKYDDVHWNQNYKGWRNMQKKDCLQTGTFEQVPTWVEKEYNEMRTSLAQELMQKIDDSLKTTDLPKILRIIKDNDIAVLYTLKEIGNLRSDEIRDKSNITNFKETMTRLRARDLIMSRRTASDHSEFDITTLGIDVLAAWEAKKNQAEQKLLL